MDISVPDALQTGEHGAGVLAGGPFVVEHAGQNSVGGYIEDVGDGTFTVWDGSRALLVDDTYTVSYDNDEIHFDSTQYDSHIVVRPIEESDTAWIPGADQYPDLSDLVNGLRNDLGDSVLNA